MPKEIGIRDRARGCLLGGAVGDALGADVEFLDIDAIHARHGPDGIADLPGGPDEVAGITDDTQMTLFTAEGLIRAWVRYTQRGICNPISVLQHAYGRWLRTQGETTPGLIDDPEWDGWLVHVRGLHSARAPGLTCLSALRAARQGELVANNNSKGCGGVMRVAPVGLLAPMLTDETAFEWGSDSARITHGHPSGYLSAGHLAAVIGRLARGDTLNVALDVADTLLAPRPDGAEVASFVGRARTLAGQGRPSPETIAALGGGWVAEEALAIAVLCALTARDFGDCIRLAANHSGDSDSTAAIAGNIWGAWHGIGAIGEDWLVRLELRDVITAIADDLASVAAGTADVDRLAERYPGI